MISIVVACRNEVGHIGAFLQSLLRQEMGDMEWEAILADGMSEDGTRAVLENYSDRHPRLRVIDNPGRIVSTGLNLAIRAARGEVILRMDSHTRYAPDYCRRCVETLQNTGADNVGGPARTDAHGNLARAIAAAYHSPFSTGGARFHDADYEGWVDTVPYGCWRRKTLERIGLFDENLVRSQDDELNFRLVRNGGRIWQNPAIVSWYSSRSRLADLFRQYLQYGFWKVAVIRKHRLPASWRHLVPVVFFLANFVPLGGIAIAAACGAKAWLTWFAVFWLPLVAVYLTVNAVASVGAARRSGWAMLPYLPMVFAVYHIAYGLGFLLGIFRFPAVHSGRRFAADSMFARITR